MKPLHADEPVGIPSCLLFDATQPLSEDGERVFLRGAWHARTDHSTVLVVLPAAEHPTPGTLDRFTHEYGLKDELDAAWAATPLELVRDAGRTALILQDPGGQPLDRLLGEPMEIGSFLRLAINIAVALGKLHHSGLVHKDLKPVNIFVNHATGEVKFTGFGLASRLPRERQSPELPETIAGTLAYMAPEQTGRMNRSIDSRSDLYALGVIFYEMLTGSLPFKAAETMEWIHCHIARQPQPPCERVEGVPASTSAIVMKLLAKMAEDRYQTVAGLEHDLRRCRSDWATLHRIDPFLLGERDIPDRLRIPEKLYGREGDIRTLLAAFDSVLTNGAPELVLISGYSGIGKSAVVNELHKVLVLPRGLFASGKFDQYKHDIPYATLAQAFGSLTRQLLGLAEAKLAKWRDNLVQALGPNGSLIVDLVPELKLIIGEQPAISELPPQEAKGRFQLVLRRFISVFARPEHPLALFLDDLQWLDAATLDLIENLLTHPDMRHLLLIGAYRDNEIGAAHPLLPRLEAIRQSGAKTWQIVLAPLDAEDLTQFTVDTLHCDPERAAPLARLIVEKAGGNPFFAIQFIATLVDEDLLGFDHAAGHWRWDLSRVEAKAYTDNVVDLMVGKLKRLSVKTQSSLKQLACLGNSAGFERLSIVQDRPEEELHAELWEARQAELIVRTESSYRFAHDRIQEAAYSLIPAKQRPAIHLKIGRMLAAQIGRDKREEEIFEIVAQCNRGAPLITNWNEREQLAEYNLIAGKRAKASTAYSSALVYLVAGCTLLGDNPWERRYDLISALELNRAECEFLTGELSAAEERLASLSNRATTTVERAKISCLQMDVFTTLGQFDQAVAVCLDYLQDVGIDWSPHPTDDEARREYERMWSALGSRSIEELIDLPLMSDANALATVDVLTKVGPPSLFTDSSLHSMVLCKAISLSLEYGNTDGSCVHYVGLSETAGPRFGDYEAGFRFGRLGYELVEQRGLRRFRPATYMVFGGIVLPWATHVREGRDLIYRALKAANECGDLTYAGYSSHFIVTNRLTSGDVLGDVQREAEIGLRFAQNARFGFVVDVITAQLGLIRTLRGLTPAFGCFSDGQFDEHRFEEHLASHPAFALPACWYWIRKLQARFLSADYAAAIEAATKAEKLLWTSPSELETADYHLYAALSRAACCDGATTDERQVYLKSLIGHHQQLQVWAANCSANFSNRAALVGAEIARIEDRELDAQRLYESAINSARENFFVHNEGLANELAARFYSTRGFRTIARAYLREARSCYLRWGAEGKVRYLEAHYPYLHEGGSALPAIATTATRLEQLDLATVIKVSQAVSSEIVPEKLIDTLMRTAIEQAGAERGLLIIPRDAEPRIAAEAMTKGDAITVHVGDEAVAEGLLPESVLQYVLRTHESVIIDDAATEVTFAADPYLRQHKARSILCLPLLNQAKFVGALFLENHLAVSVFAPAQVTVLRLVSSLAAIALENSRLYSDLQEREAKIRRLVDANIIGILIFDLEGQIIEANDAFLHMVGYERKDLVSGRMRWTDLTPPEWRESDTRRIEEVKLKGTLQPFEKEYSHRDGSRVPVLVGVARFEESVSQGVAFVIDLTARKRAESEAGESERRFREAQMELAHANRVSTMGQLTASIAHEVNQPITAMIGNAEATLRWLTRKPPDMEETRLLLARIIREGRRASNIINRVRNLTKKAPLRMERLEINDAISEVIEITRGEVMKNSIALRTSLGDSLPTVEADRTQLQQVVLNLIINAVQALSEGDQDPRELLISTSMDEPGVVVVTVRDSGPGLSAETLGRLFDPFYTTKPDGMGMGLSICQSIVEGHRGRIWATANVPRGAAFHFTIPIAHQ